MNLPNTQTSDILEMEADRELLVYDLRHNRAYNLNETSKIIYRACGDQLSFDELKRTNNFTDDLIYLALDELDRNNLLENYQSSHFAGLSRREVIKKVGLASMIALPVIAGLTAPNAIQAASCINRGGRLTGITVSATNQNPTNDTAQNQFAIAPKLTAQCCNNSYNNFVSNGCSDGLNATCTASAVCN